jgi:hypothetical protein
MATSAPLSATRRLRHSSARRRDQPARRRGSPIYPARPFFPCRRPCSGGPRDCVRRCLGREFRLRRFRIGSATTSPTFPERVGRLTKRQRSRNATAWRSCWPRSGQGFYDRACLGRVTPDTQVGYHWMAHRHLPSPDLHRLDRQPYGLRPKETKKGERKEERGRTGSQGALRFCIFFRFLRLYLLGFFRSFLSEEQDLAPLQYRNSSGSIRTGSRSSLHPNCAFLDIHIQQSKHPLSLLSNDMVVWATRGIVCNKL